MRHSNSKSNLGSKNDASYRVIRNMVTSLFMKGKVRTTKAHLRSVITITDKLITFAKTHDIMNTIRECNSYLYTEAASRQLVDVVLPKFKDVTSGFTTKKNIGFRKGDGAEMFEIKIRG